MDLKYPESKTGIDDMCEIIEFFNIKKTEYTDCAILYEVTFDQLRAIYNLGKDHAVHNEWLNNNCHPHVAVIIDQTSAVLYEGDIGYTTEAYVKD